MDYLHTWLSKHNTVWFNTIIDMYLREARKHRLAAKGDKWPLWTGTGPQWPFRWGTVATGQQSNVAYTLQQHIF